MFAPTGYGLAFGYDSSDFIPFSQAIIDLKEDAEVARFEEQQKYNIGTKAEIFLQETCNVSDDSEEFTLLEFGGLFVMVGFTISVGLLVQILQKGAVHTTKSFRKYNIKRKASKPFQASKKVYVHPIKEDSDFDNSSEDNYEQDSVPAVLVDDDAIISAVERVLSKESSRKALFNTINNARMEPEDS